MEENKNARAELGIFLPLLTKTKEKYTYEYVHLTWENV